MYLLDTNVVSELRKPRPHGGVLAWMRTVPETSLFISAVTLGEIQRGIERTRPHDPEKAVALDAWADEIAATPNLLPMTGVIFRLWAKLMHSKAEALYEDTMLAATARVHGLTLATRNVRDFTGVDVLVTNPFEYAEP
jgi:predicted nucleic acid-binding protein